MTQQKIIITLMTCFLAIIYMVFNCPGDETTIAIVLSRDLAPYQNAVKGFRETLKAKNLSVAIENYDMQDDFKRGLEIMKQLKASKPGLIVTVGSAATEVAHREIKDIPIVFSMVLNPVDSGFANSIKASGNNMTGASMDISIRAQFAQLNAVMPNLRKIGVLYNPQNTKTVVDEATQTAEAMRLELIATAVTEERQVPKALERLCDKVDALWGLADDTVFTPQSTRFILIHTLRNRVPFMGLSPAYVKAGALLALSWDYEDIGRQAGESAIRILAGEAPEAIPITIPRNTFLFLNHRTAKRIGIKFSDKILQKAGRIYK